MLVSSVPAALPVAASAAVIAFVVLLVVFALAIVFAAIWYHLRQPKEVRLDEDLDEEEGFVYADAEERD